MADPAGSLSLAKKHLIDTLANVAAFQSFVGAADATEALARIYRAALPPPADNAESYSPAELANYRAYALVWTDEEEGFQRVAVARSDHHDANESGRFTLRLVRTIPAEIVGDPDECELTFDNAIGQIIDGLFELAGLSGYLAIDTIAISGGPFVNHPDIMPTQGDHQSVELGIDWSAG